MSYAPATPQSKEKAEKREKKKKKVKVNSKATSLPSVITRKLFHSTRVVSRITKKRIILAANMAKKRVS